MRTLGFRPMESDQCDPVEANTLDWMNASMKTIKVRLVFVLYWKRQCASEFFHSGGMEARVKVPFVFYTHRLIRGGY